MVRGKRISGGCMVRGKRISGRCRVRRKSMSGGCEVRIKRLSGLMRCPSGSPPKFRIRIQGSGFRVEGVWFAEIVWVIVFGKSPCLNTCGISRDLIGIQRQLNQRQSTDREG